MASWTSSSRGTLEASSCGILESTGLLTLVLLDTECRLLQLTELSSPLTGESADLERFLPEYVGVGLFTG